VHGILPLLLHSFFRCCQADARAIAKEALEAVENKEEKDVSAYIKVAVVGSGLQLNSVGQNRIACLLFNSGGSTPSTGPLGTAL
jgi:hypothetical protein